MVRILLISLFVLLQVRSSVAVNREQAVSRARQIVADQHYQKKLLEEKMTSGMKVSGQRRVRSSSPAPIGLAEILMVLGIALVVALAAIGLASFLSRRKEETSNESAGEESIIGNQLSPQLSKVKRLAAAGLFAEAVHELFLLAVVKLSRNRGHSTAVSHTGRELSRLLPASNVELEHFSLLLQAVELSLFGGKPVDQAMYQRCLQSFRALVPSS